MFLTGRVVFFCGGQGLAGKRWSPSRLEAGQPCKERDGKERGCREVLKKRRGMNAPLYLTRAADWQIGGR